MDGVTGVRAHAPAARLPDGHLFVAAGGGGDVLAASVLQRKLAGAGPLPHVVTYSWDRLMVDPVAGPRGPDGFENLTRFGDHNYIVSAGSRARSPGRSLLPRLARELSTRLFLLDPRGGATGMRRQLAELIARLDIGRVSLVDSGGDILAAGHERELRSPLPDSLVLAAADGLDAQVDVLVAGAGLDGELTPQRVRETVVELGGHLDRYRLAAHDVAWCQPVLRWHPSEVNGLLFVAANGYRGTVEIRAAALRVRVDEASAAVHRCTYEHAIGHNLLAKSMIETDSFDEVERAIAVIRNDRSEIDHQRGNAWRDSDGSARGRDVDERLAGLLRYSNARGASVDALTLRRAAEVMGVDIIGLRALAPALSGRFPRRYEPPLWHLR